MRKLSVLIAVLMLCVLAVPALAIDDPNTVPAINAVYAYEDLKEEGDFGVLVDYFLDYDPVPGIPDEIVTESYFVSFIDTDGTTQLKAVAPYAYNDSGYQRGLAWIYFTAAEVTTYSIDAADEALYRVWLVGNPTVPSGWAGDPPKTISAINDWLEPTEGDANVLLALRILYYADLLEQAWTIDMVEVTSLGNRLATAGETYFDNVIIYCRQIAPGAYSAGTVEPVDVDQDYTTVFGATMTDGSGTVVGSPITLVSGPNTVVVTGSGTFTLELEAGTRGTAASVAGGSVVTNSPVTLVPGTNTITASNAGTGQALITVALVNTATEAEDTITGTGFDLTTLAGLFGIDPMMFSTLVWLLITIIICAAVYKNTARDGYTPGAGKVVLVVFNICIVGGALMGMLNFILAALMFVLFGIFAGYVLFFRNANV